MGGIVILLHFLAEIDTSVRFGGPVSIIAGQLYVPGIAQGQVQETATEIG